ncbi:heavy metal translocating P-type ATPase [Poriferisphaera sp. WC338]|uniref:heavy metal translocating P-type ATPase n=1 Tax=Poriferisphaera sp. WC338 TaxID=3425129 RepID=UPI003D819F24
MTQVAGAQTELSGHDEHEHKHGEDCGHGCDHDHGEKPILAENQVDFKIKLVLFGGTMLITAAIAQWFFDTSFQTDVLAMIASILLGGPIVWDAAKAMLTGKCPHSHGKGDKCDHDHEHEHSHDGAHMEELVALAVIAAFADGQYLECGAVAFFMLIASFIEHRTAVGAQQTIESLIRITPTRAHLLKDGVEEEIDAAKLVPGDVVVVRPGDKIPGDGVIRKGMSAINQANITGESVPVEKSVDDEAFSGTINETGILEIEITRAGKDSTLGKVQSLITQAAATKPVVVRLLDKYAGYYTPVVLMIAAIVWYFTGDIDTCITLLLIACPCAIILAAPTAMVASLSSASRLGVYVKTVSDLEVAKQISAIVFDKTGTLTVGELEVTKLTPVEGVGGADLLQTCVAAEHNSKHPVAKAVVAMGKKAKLTVKPSESFEEVAGRGVKCVIEGAQVIVGRQAFLEDEGVSISGLDMAGSEGLSLLFVARDGKLIGWVGLEDKVRAGAADAMDELEIEGVKRRVMITGDRRSPALRVAQELHLTDFEAEALPGDKLELVKMLKSKGHKVAVIGDGVNDGPALAAGDVSIAMGAAGSDVAIHTATIALMNNNLNRIPFLIRLSKRTVTVIRQNLIGTLIYILAMVALLFGLKDVISPLVAAIMHGVSSIIVVFNSARLVREGENIIDHVPVDVEEPARKANVESVQRVEPATATA